MFGLIQGMEYHSEMEVKASPFGKFIMAFGVN